MFSIIGCDCILAVATSVGGMANLYTESVKVTKNYEKSVAIVSVCEYQDLGRFLWFHYKW